jgi:cytochrome P450
MANAPVVERPAHVPVERVVQFDFYNPPGVEQGLQEAWKSLQRPDISLVWTPYNSGHWIATRAKEIGDVFADYKRFSARVVVVPKEIGEIHKIIPNTLDPPYQRPFRTLLNNVLSPAAVNPMEGAIRATAVELIEQIRPRGECEFNADFAAHLPIRIFMTMVDLPLEDVPKLKYWMDQLVKPNPVMPYEEVFQLYHDYFTPVVKSRIGGSGTDAITDIVNRTVDGRPQTLLESLNLLTVLLMGGLDTVYNFLAYAFLFLARSPEHRRQLVEDPALIRPAVTELLRRFPIVNMAREVREDIEWDGVLLKKGEMIVAPSPLFGLDERVNAEPLKVDFHRKRMEHATFGKGHHICPGSHLGSLEARIAIEEWLKRIPDFSVKPGADIRFQGGIIGSLSAVPLVWNLTNATVA